MEEERGRKELQTNRGGGVSFVAVGPKADNPLLISTTGRDKSRQTSCLTCNSVTADVSLSLFQHQSISRHARESSVCLLSPHEACE